MRMTETDSLSDYLQALSSKAATPGGGAAAGLTGAQACALISMVCNLTRTRDSRIPHLLAIAEEAQTAFMSLAQQDMARFDAVMAAWRSPAQGRDERLQPALQAAAEVPLEMIDLAVSLIDCVRELAEIGNANLVTDTGIASLLIEATVRSARLNVLVNIKSIKNPDFVARARDRLADALGRLPELTQVNSDIDTQLT